MSAIPQPGVPPRDGDVTVGPMLDGVMWLFAALATCALILRTYVRVVILRHVSWDDALLGTSLVYYLYQLPSDAWLTVAGVAVYSMRIHLSRSSPRFRKTPILCSPQRPE